MSGYPYDQYYGQDPGASGSAGDHGNPSNAEEGSSIAGQQGVTEALDVSQEEYGPSNFWEGGDGKVLSFSWRPNYMSRWYQVHIVQGEAGHDQVFGQRENPNEAFDNTVDMMCSAFAKSPIDQTMQRYDVYKTRMQTGALNSMGPGSCSVLICTDPDNRPVAAAFSAKNTKAYKEMSLRPYPPWITQEALDRLAQYKPQPVEIYVKELDRFDLDSKSSRARLLTFAGVDPELQGQGLGVQMLRSLVDTTKDDITLSSGNFPAVEGIYRRLGFLEVKEGQSYCPITEDLFFHIQMYRPKDRTHQAASGSGASSSKSETSQGSHRGDGPRRSGRSTRSGKR